MRTPSRNDHVLARVSRQSSQSLQTQFCWSNLALFKRYEPGGKVLKVIDVGRRQARRLGQGLAPTIENLDTDAKIGLPDRRVPQRDRSVFTMQAMTSRNIESSVAARDLLTSLVSEFDVDSLILR